jgi:hypothetical protein
MTHRLSDLDIAILEVLRSEKAPRSLEWLKRTPKVPRLDGLFSSPSERYFLKHCPVGFWVLARVRGESRRHYPNYPSLDELRVGPKRQREHCAGAKANWELITRPPAE